MKKHRNLNEDIYKIISQEVHAYIWRNLAPYKGKKRAWRLCICGCGQHFRYRTKYHQFASRKCYSRFHRIKGFVRRIIDQKD